MRIYLILIVPLLTLVSTQAQSRETMHKFDISSAIQRGYDEGVLDKTIPVYFKGMKRKKYSKVISHHKTSKKTNKFGKSDESACQWALLSALRAFQATAKREGGRAVINIVSNYKHNVYSSASKFECGAGNIIAGVALKGDIAK